MCGFVAIRGAAKAGELARMAEAVAARGPDDRGEAALDGFAAIHHRLAIIGPDARGRQPMTIDGITVLFNGCIYNYPVLRARLEKEGVVFHSDTDTEILPHLYRRFGFGMFGLLNGMFAIALWDAREKLMLIARDPFGEKPLFVCEQGGRVGLASTLGAFERGDWHLSPNTAAVRDILTTMRVEAPATLYREVRQLPAGCYAVLRDGEAEMTLCRYFLLPEPDQPRDWAPEERDHVLADLLDDAFRLRALADRPLGVFLSGGIDSSLVAESLARQLPQPLHTFAVRFGGGTADYDETPHAEAVARHIGSRHAVLDVDADARQCLDDLAAAFDQPVANAAALPTWLIARAAREHVVVALSGVGGDELFGGYPRYLGMRWHARLQAIPGRSLLLAAVGAMGEGDGSRNRRGRLRRFVAGLDQPAAEAYRHWTRTAEGSWDTMFRLPAPPAMPCTWPSAAEAMDGLEGLLARYGPVRGAMAYDVLTYLGDDLLAMDDRMSMAHALELRAPFLDTRLLAMAMSMDEEDMVAGMPWQEHLKQALRRVARRRLPAAVVDRPKQGFMAPLKHWLRGDLASDIEAMIDAGPLSGLVRPEYARGEWMRHQGGEDRSDMLWALLLMDRWMRHRGWDFT
jgi:asparagine synthase (glutamine-hydrolysing)